MARTRRIPRRTALKIGASAAALPLARIRAATAGANRVLRYTHMGDISSLDPHWSALATVSVHNFAAFDTLFGMTGDYQASPQMVEGYQVEADGKRWTLTLREGLKFHDGEPVLARDCAASVRRWGQRNPYGQTLLAATDDISAADDRNIVFRLKKPFPRPPEALSTATPPIPAMMPERLAKTDAATQITENFGSGPYRLKADERVAGYRTVYERFPEYRPRQDGTPDWTAGPKIVHFDRVEWTVIPAGLAFARVVEQYPEIELYAADKRHPSLAGSYLAAAVTYMTLFDRQPVGLSYTAGLDPAIARALQEAARDTVRDYLRR